MCLRLRAIVPASNMEPDPDPGASAPAEIDRGHQNRRPRRLGSLPHAGHIYAGAVRIILPAVFSCSNCVCVPYQMKPSRITRSNHGDSAASRST